MVYVMFVKNDVLAILARRGFVTFIFGKLVGGIEKNYSIPKYYVFLFSVLFLISIIQVHE